jgi:D-alanyl-D-alanine carboxypeptidase
MYASQTQSVQTDSQSALAAVSVPEFPQFGSIDLTAKASFVGEVNGPLVYAANPDAQLPLASISKIALVLAVVDVLDADSKVTLQQFVSGNGKGENLPLGTTWRTQDLIDYTLVASSNDGADVLAALADSKLRALYPEAPRGRAALWRMNALAQELGLEHTYFSNVSGLDESSTQSGSYGSAKDVAKLMAYAAIQYPNVFNATNLKTISITSREGIVAVAENTDEAIDYIPGMLIGKTGLTDLAGGNLAVVFDARGRKYVAVVLGSTQSGRFSDMTKIASILSKKQ